VTSEEEVPVVVNKGEFMETYEVKIDKDTFMTMGYYQNQAAKTAVYPDKGTGNLTALSYVGLGLAGEAGEVAGKIKKLIRDKDTPGARVAIVAELGDVLWYVAMLAHELGVELGTCAIENMEKLASRAQRGVIGGSGDNR
jgi:NTP pyrophosphatase (non-canonical NTP hydrolase)